MLFKIYPSDAVHCLSFVLSACLNGWERIGQQAFPTLLRFLRILHPRGLEHKGELMYHTSKRRTDPLFRESQGKGLRVERSGFYFRSWHRQGFTSCARALPFVAEFYRCRYYTCFFAKILQLVQIHWFVLSPNEVFKRFLKQQWKSFFSTEV